MSILGVDYGLSKVGTAKADAKLAEPLIVLRYKDENELIIKIKDLIQEHNVNKIVVGISEGKSAEEAKNFVKKLKKELEIEIIEFDETLSTSDAQRLSKEAGVKRKKRKRLEDAFAATLILQQYLDLS